MELAENFAADMIAAYKTGKIEDYFAYLDEQDDEFFDQFGDEIDEAIDIITSDDCLTEGIDASLDDIYDWQEMTEGLKMWLADRKQAIGNAFSVSHNRKIGRHTQGLLTQKKDLASERRGIVHNAKAQIHGIKSAANRRFLRQQNRLQNSNLKKDMRSARKVEFKKRLHGMDATQEHKNAEDATKKYKEAVSKNGVLGFRGEQKTVRDRVGDQKEVIRKTKEREQSIRTELDAEANETDAQREAAAKKKEADKALAEKKAELKKQNAENAAKASKEAKNLTAEMNRRNNGDTPEAHAAHREKILEKQRNNAEAEDSKVQDTRDQEEKENDDRQAKEKEEEEAARKKEEANKQEQKKSSAPAAPAPAKEKKLDKPADKKAEKAPAHAVKTEVSTPQPSEKAGEKKSASVNDLMAGVKAQAAKATATKEDLDLDYALYQTLDENGYIPSKKNLDDLKEGLISGKYVLFNSDTMLDEDAPLTETASLLEMLDSNGYLPTKKNLDTLRQMIDAGRVLFY